MLSPATINPHIVEALYCEALVLSDEVRLAFTLPSDHGRAPSGREEDPVRIALSSEGLRTTTRMMHAIAWLLNHRACFMGEISEAQLRRNGRLSPALGHSEPRQLALLGPEVAELVESTRRLYDRLLRLDGRWRLGEERQASAIERLRERIEERMAG